ncbi:MAG TPA: hypothetical protein VI997_05690 [Candidatus Thermoplasmatota archaeon]|nr:hypothetical protein [Candidatus Thermoplasmatota archaeon]
MTLRVLVAGGLREPGLWDAFAKTFGEGLAREGVGLSLPWSSGFGRAAAEGFLKAAPAAGALRVFPGEGEPPSAPAALREAVREYVPGTGSPRTQALRASDAVVLAGNGPGLSELCAEATRRGVPVIPLAIPQTTTEDLWERHVGSLFARADVAAELRTAFLGLRRLDPRSSKAAATLASVARGLAGAPELPGGPHVLLATRPAAAATPDAALDGLPLVLRRALRATSPGARIDPAPEGWLRSPGRGLLDALRSADLTIVDLSGGVGEVYALGLARGAGRGAVALLPREARPGLDPTALGAILWSDERDLAARLERAIEGELRQARAPPRTAGRGRSGKRRPKRGPRAAREGSAPPPREATGTGPGPDAA